MYRTKTTASQLLWVAAMCSAGNEAIPHVLHYSHTSSNIKSDVRETSCLALAFPSPTVAAYFTYPKRIFLSIGSEDIFLSLTLSYFCQMLHTLIYSCD